METLHQRLTARVDEWRRSGYPCEDHPAIAEILEYSVDPESGGMRYLRRPQLQALETYWYLRLVEGTPRILSLYEELYPSTPDLLEALGLQNEAITRYLLDVKDLQKLWDRIRTDDDFVRDLKLEAVRETLTLDYPSYILALAMGAGKTVLIGAIMATEFAMAMEYPDGPFVQNALVFAPGKTIIESLRELAEVPYDRILPPRMHKPFAASVKLTFTRDGEKDIPVVRKSTFNVIVTNTEKIRIQKETIRKKDLAGQTLLFGEDAARAEVANLRLQAVASLPHLAIFSDEAHHTYGQSLDTELKKVRKTVDYLAANTNVIATINTTGTPYFKRQPLRDVIYWYGLAQGIREGYLKDLSGNIQAYEFDGDAARYVEHVVRDFFEAYGDHALPDGSPAKIAVYFPQTDDLKELRPVVEKALMEVGQSPAVCLTNTSDAELTRESDIDAFNRLNDPASPHRVMLLVNKGTEGWNCPSLFACALARKLKTSNNFVLQAATRCLRQIPGNDRKARVYLSTENFAVLDRQLQETYGETISDLNGAAHESRRDRIVLRKLDIPPLVVTQVVKTVVKMDGEAGELKLSLPKDAKGGLVRHSYTLAEQHATASVLREMGDAVTIKSAPEGVDAYSAAVDLAGRYRLDVWAVMDELRRLYGADDIPHAHLGGLAEQIEKLTRRYEVREERVDVALALVKPEGFDKETEADGTEVYTAEIVYPKDRERLIARFDAWKDKAGGLGFHYDPYDFDSKPEERFFELVLAELKLRPEEIEDIYFTGALTDPAKTDFYVEYKDEKGKWRRYTPDFVIRKKPDAGRRKGTGRVYIVEIKDARLRDNVIDGENGRKAIAVRKWEKLNPDRLRYEMIFASTDAIAHDQLQNVREFIAGEEA